MIVTLNNTPEARDTLLDIEDKLRERGALVRLTGDSSADVTLRFSEWGDGEDRGPYLLIEIDSPEVESDADTSIAEDISDYVSDKLSDASADWPAAEAEQLGALFGHVVLLNGVKIY
ncbi:MAG: hypothetical protein R3C08_16550 [Hyphomonas sp.]